MPARRVKELQMPRSGESSDLELARHAFAVKGFRVRCYPDIDAETADRLLARGLVELHDDFDEFLPGEAHRCLRATQYGFDLVLGRIDA